MSMLLLEMFSNTVSLTGLFQGNVHCHCTSMQGHIMHFTWNGLEANTAKSVELNRSSRPALKGQKLLILRASKNLKEDAIA